MDSAAAITRKHVVDASKFAHMVGGQAGSAIAGLLTPREPQQDVNLKLVCPGKNRKAKKAACDKDRLYVIRKGQQASEGSFVETFIMSRCV
ncbi:hypothetical protein DUNSADRAFT_11108 [Dunaliella salina]|uniref:Encoded protein n=1 Tax=Dunaliella salina TaxID=3046 RepID=A0ABQ7H4K1_DUNSA|nr:hypothetical protein DUNSADRAFT_11108 [Dunaliella salina]|eukprot:KAF5841792.1 hypothetical protein DUNSADRAFT_11108 [Dunaliella salina]